MELFENYIDVSKLKQLKNIIELLRVYVKTATVEQRKFGEVMTPLETVKEMISILPPDVWQNPNLKWLDPCNGVGTFTLLVIYKLMMGLKNVIINENDRYKHIVENMITVYEIQSKNMDIYKLLIDPNNEYKLNAYCDNFLASNINMKYDIILGNPPYQEELITKKGSAKPLYNLFIEKSINMTNYLLFITPSRWFAGGKGLDNFRYKMKSSNKIKYIKHFDDATAIFGKSVEIKGGVSYFLYDNSHNGICNFNGTEMDLSVGDIISSNNKFDSVLRKLNDNKSITEIYIGTGYTGIQTNDNRLVDTKLNDEYIKVYVSKQKGFIKYIHIDNIKKSAAINNWKVFTPEAANSGGEGFGNIFIGEPGSVCSGTYIVFNVNSELESNYLILYLKTKFVDKLLCLRKITHHINSSALKWIPLVPIDRIWTDELLFDYFGLDETERKLFVST